MIATEELHGAQTGLPPMSLGGVPAPMHCEGTRDADGVTGDMHVGPRELFDRLAERGIHWGDVSEIVLPLATVLMARLNRYAPTPLSRDAMAAAALQIASRQLDANLSTWSDVQTRKTGEVINAARITPSAAPYCLAAAEAFTEEAIASVKRAASYGWRSAPRRDQAPVDCLVGATLAAVILIRQHAARMMATLSVRNEPADAARGA